MNLGATWVQNMQDRPKTEAVSSGEGLFLLDLASVSADLGYASAGFAMAILNTLFGGQGLVAAAGRHPDFQARIEWLGGLLLVASFVGLGFDLAQATG